MILRAELVDRVDQHTEVFRVDIGRDAVPEIENMPGPLAVTRQRVRDTLADYLRALAKSRRVQVAL